MARSARSTTVFFRHEGVERRDIYMRIAPSAIAYSQSEKGGVVDTLGGYFREVLRSSNPQRNGLKLPELTIRATTGVAYRKELQNLLWIWRNSKVVDPKTNKPADLYFFDVTKMPDAQGIVRASDYGYLINIRQFAFDDSVDKFGQIPFTMQCQILSDLFFKVADPPATVQPLPTRKPKENAK